ncbi:type IV pilus twitching motility protein PilT [Patescibacteria group bacterium]|nr:type IV pilus twitching motility protein PilT [Patescibacteria group bacterium]
MLNQQKKFGSDESKLLEQLLDTTIDQDASDLHIVAENFPVIRVDGDLKYLEEYSRLSSSSTAQLCYAMMDERQRERLIQIREIDFSFPYKDDFRFRANIFYQKGTISAALRLIKPMDKTFEELGLPPIIERFTKISHGLVLVTGPTGHGKSTTLASLINTINQTRRNHILTIEDPIEHIFHSGESLIEQREVPHDSKDFSSALRAALRQDPDVVLIGEMRDLETISAALTVAETGHLVFGTLHTNDAAQTADRIINVFPSHQQQQVRTVLSNVVEGVVSQRLLKKKSGGRIAACEIMTGSMAVRSLIREGKAHQLQGVIQTSAADGMITLDKSLADMVKRGIIDLDEALSWAIDADNLKTLIA